MSDEKEDTKTTVVLSQLVAKGTRSTLNTIANTIEKHCIEKQKKSPKKGEVLDYLVKKGAADFDINDFFQNR